MPAAKYQIVAEQGSSFSIHFLYKDSEGDPVDLTGHSARMQVRRSAKTNKIILNLSTSGITGGGTGGEFVVGGGVAGTGGILLNASTGGTTGAAGTTGGIYVSIDDKSMSNAPDGRHFYDLELVDPQGKVRRLVEGFFEIPPEITK